MGSSNYIFNNYSTGRHWIWVGYNHLVSNKREWNNCFIKNAHKIFLNLPDLILLEQTGKDKGLTLFIAEKNYYLSRLL